MNLDIISIDPENKNHTIPKTYGVYKLSTTEKGLRYRYGNHPVRMKELERKHDVVQLVALFFNREDAKAYVSGAKAPSSDNIPTKSVLREELVALALRWQETYGVAPSVTSTISEYDAAKLVGMTDTDYANYMQDKTAVARGHDFIYNGIKYQIKAHRPSGKPGSKISNAGKARNYEWDILIWIRYDKNYEIQEAWSWDRARYIELFDSVNRISPDDMRQGTDLLRAK